MALTFDDGPRARTTTAMLDVLRGRHVRATFFAVGQQVARYPSLARRERAEGHRVENHSYRHENLSRLSTAAVQSTLRRTTAAGLAAGLSRMRLYRPPYGATSPRIRSAAAALGLREVLWTVDPQDWRTGRSAASIRDRVLTHLAPNAVILLHDGVANSSATVAALPGIIDGARARGYCLGTLSDSGGIQRPAPKVSLAGATVTEGAFGTVRSAKVALQLSARTSHTVSVRLRTASGTARSGSDFRAVDRRVSVPAGWRGVTVTIPVVGDNRDEPTEMFSASISAPRYASLGTSRATVVVLDDDPPSAVGMNDATFTEPATGTKVVTIPLRLSRPSGRATSVRVKTWPLTARAADFTGVDAVYSFAAGSTLRYVRVTVKSDTVAEPPETFRVSISRPAHLTIPRPLVTMTIRNSP